eukprot:TRINITY_DN61392_c0_g1_i1.p1 TRINITY_DN61392_c0_g1~~TRINITY_DN61392_c0_g1_i1.p1  ORF type:complete len:450 (+),score=98.78 TRINITY_DN61392_c0_g1_i1:111-1460(+)
MLRSLVGSEMCIRDSFGVRSRELISNFNMLIAVITVTLLCAALKGHFWHVGCNNRRSSAGNLGAGCTIADVLLLDVPSSFGPTDTHRDWLIKFWNLTDMAAVGQSILYGLLLALLFFVEQNITSVMLAKPENKLQKGPAFHWDMFCVGLMVVLCGLFGLPVAHASLPHSLYHVRALANKEHHPPQPPAKHDYTVTIKSVTETRWSALAINGLIIATIPGLKLFDKVPLPVVYGLFFFMGYSALLNNPMVKRLTYFFYEPSLFPPNHMFRKVEPSYIHMYTLIQLVCLGLIWVVKKLKPSAAYFPFVIIAMIPLRMFVLPRLFDDQGHVELTDPNGATRKLNLSELKQRTLAFVCALSERCAEQVVPYQPRSIFSSARDRKRLPGATATTNMLFIDQMTSWVEALRQPQGMHGVAKFERQTTRVVRALEVISGEDYLTCLLYTSPSPRDS